MQEGTYSLMQLAKTMGVVERVRAACVPFISVLTDPTTGGVFASFAVVGDVNIAEPNALIRFAGDRVSAGTIGEELPAGYQRAEFWFSHGFVDRIVTRAHLRDEIIALLGFLAAPPLAGAGEPVAATSSRPRSLLSALTGALAGEYGDSRNGSNGDSRNGGRGGETNGSRGEAPRG
jgi:acetyl-CoA carboxylase carboxyl transferase subunit beta